MPTINDAEFGTITLRRSARASSVRLKVGPNGLLRASLPLYSPLFLVKRLIERSRPELRALMQEHYKSTVFENGMQIGKSHTIVVTPSQQRTTTVRRVGQQIQVSLRTGDDLTQSEIQRQIHDVVLQAIRLEAKSYLPKRLAYLAQQHGFMYTKLRFSHSSGRWGSCSSNGTISLNIALMRLPFELIDYVLVHELSHTIEMNHSADFWKLVATCDPLYVTHRTRLKEKTPVV